MQETDTIIIGGGAAGLAAAVEITRAAKTVAILEARDRLGGRIHTLRDAHWAMPVELGAEFVHGKPKELLQIIRAADLLACDTQGEHWHLRDGRLQTNNDFWQKVQRIMSKLVEAASPPEKDETFADFLARCCGGDALREARELALAFVEGFEAAPADRISAASLAKAQKSAENSGGYQSMRLVGGYDRVIEFLRDSIDSSLAMIHLRSIVHRISWRRGSVEVQSRGPNGEARQTIHARRAIITLPIGVLQVKPPAAGAIEFDPPLPQKQEAINRLAMGAVVKIVIQFRSAFWEDQHFPTMPPDQTLAAMSFMHGRSMPFATWWSFYPLRTRTLVGWAGGPSTDSLLGRSHQEMFAKALETLSRMLGWPAEKIEREIERWQVADWQSDPFSRGAYSYVPVGALDAVKTLADSVEQTLFFAGEATDYETLSGTVDSAIRTGQREGRKG